MPGRSSRPAIAELPEEPCADAGECAGLRRAVEPRLDAYARVGEHRVKPGIARLSGSSLCPNRRPAQSRLASVDTRLAPAHCSYDTACLRAPQLRPRFLPPNR
jgi:hypothetical protein